MDEIDRISELGYVPSHDDILRAHVRTLGGIVEEAYIRDRVNFEMYDVGGQRNNRKKWIHCFEHVDAIIFVVDLSDYDVIRASGLPSTNTLDPSSQNKHLPRELLLKITEFVGREDVKRMGKVCKFWSEVCPCRVSRMDQSISSFEEVMLDDVHSFLHSII